MKHTVLSLLLATVFAFTSCTDTAFLPEPPAPDDGSRAIVPGNQSETNPTLLTDWENCPTIYLNEVSGGGQPIAVTAPWANGVSTVLENTFRTDIKKADGWIMLFHTFTRANEDPGQAYLCLYNRFTGYVKVFYYATKPNTTTNSVWTISSNDLNTPRALFSDSEYFSQPLESDNNYTVWSITADNMVTSGHSGIKQGWNGFEFRVGEYNPENSEGTFSIDAYNTTYTNFNFNGEETSTTTGTITTINTNSQSVVNNALAKAAINQTGEQAKKAIDKFAESNLNKNFLGINFKDILAKVSAGDYANAITSGVGFVFKSLFKKDPKYSVSEVKLQTQGTITLQGNSETPTVATIDGLSFTMKDILTPTIDPSKPIIIVPRPYTALSELRIIKTELGVWNLKKKPTLYYERYTKFRDEVGAFEDYGGGALDFHGMLDLPQTRVGDIEVVFNPDIAPYVKSYSVSTGVIDVVGGNRSINNKGKAIIEYNRANKLTESNGITVYGVNNWDRDFYTFIDGIPSNIGLSNDTQLYVDWGENVGGNRAAVVTLTMNVDYNGRQFSLTESRVYDVTYAPTTNNLPVSYFNNPPSSYILNQAGNTIYSSNL